MFFINNFVKIISIKPLIIASKYLSLSIYIYVYILNILNIYSIYTEYTVYTYGTYFLKTCQSCAQIISTSHMQMYSQETPCLSSSADQLLLVLLSAYPQALALFHLLTMLITLSLVSFISADCLLGNIQMGYPMC